MDRAAIGAPEYGLTLGDTRGGARCHVAIRRMLDGSTCGKELLRHDRHVTRGVSRQVIQAGCTRRERLHTRFA